MMSVDKILNKEIEENRTPSVQYLFFDKERVIHQFRNGFADIKCGIRTTEDTTYHAFSHAGGGGGFYCEIRIYPDKGTGSVVMFNRTGMRDERFLDKPDIYFL
jgi:hypothetical protein